MLLIVGVVESATYYGSLMSEERVEKLKNFVPSPFHKLSIQHLELINKWLGGAGHPQGGTLGGLVECRSRCPRDSGLANFQSRM